MQRRLLACILPCCFATAIAAGNESDIQPQSQGEVRFVTGGVGADEQAAMKAVRNDYNLSLLFSRRGTGEYVSDVNLRITDSQGRTVLETISQGPMLFAKLKPGRYVVSVGLDGQTMHQTATIGGRNHPSLSFALSTGNGN